MAHNPAPTSNKNLASYHRPELQAIEPQLKRAKDCWHLLPRDKGEAGNRSSRSVYLPKEQGEPAQAYAGRLARSSYPSTYRDAIRAFAGLLSRFNLVDPPESFDRSQNDIDMRGSSLRKFLTDIDQYVLRDGAAAVMVEMPPEDPNIQSKADEINSGRRPYLVCLERDQVINWRTHLEGGKECLDLCVIKLDEEVEDGPYGSEMEEIFMVMVPGAWRKIKINRGKQRGDVPTEEIMDEGTTSLSEIPIVWFGATSNMMGESDVVMDALAQLSIEHMQLRSDLAELIHRCALPVAVRTGDSMTPDGSPKPMTIGPNSVLDLPEGGSFGWAEISGNSLQRHQEEVSHVEKLMKEASLSFLWGDNGNRTATEAALSTSHVSSQIRSLIEAKMSAMRQVLALWTAYTSEPLETQAGLAMNDSMISKPMEAQDVGQITSLNTNGLLSHESTLNELQRGGVLDPDMDIGDELDRVAYEQVLEQERMNNIAGAGAGTLDPEEPSTFAPQMENNRPGQMPQPFDGEVKRLRQEGLWSSKYPSPTMSRQATPRKSRSTLEVQGATRQAQRSPGRYMPIDK